jgi:hypothetical protein
VNAAALYFFDDGGGVRVPSSWKLQYWNGSVYVDLPSSYPVAVNQFNNATFAGVTTTRLRAVLTSGTGSVGLVEFKALQPAT